MASPRLQLLGPPHAVQADGRRVALAAREAALLARLWLDGPCPRAAMAGFLWPRADEQRARANLRQTLLRLKRDVGAVLTETDGVLALVPEAVAPDDSPAARGAASPASACLLGPLEFDDAPELAEWLAERRARVQRDRLREGLRAAQQALRAGRTDEALAAADAVLTTEPAVEEAHRVRMQVFLARGDRAAAIGAWDDCREALRRAFGIAPSAATQALGREALSDPSDLPANGAAPNMAPTAPTPARTFVGRETAVERLNEGLSAGHAVLVLGAAGMGKSRLLAECLPPGPATWWVRARPGDELHSGVGVARLLAAASEPHEPHEPQPTGMPLVQDLALQRTLQDLLPREVTPAGSSRHDPSSTSQDHRRRLSALGALLRHLRARGVRQLVVDDLQWMDPLSLEALGVALGDWAPGAADTLPQPVLAARSGPLPPLVQRLLDALQAGGRTVRVELAPLGPTDLVRWLQTEADGIASPEALAPALHARVGGNPAFVADALRALRRRGGPPWQPDEPLPLPANLVDSVRARLADLPPTALQLAQLAAVAGSDFSLALAAAACGCAPLALAPHFRALEDADVLTPHGFVHDLVHEAVSSTLPETLRAPLHGLVADHLAAHGGPLARLAHHRRAAGQTAEAADAFQRAGEAARHRWRMVEAAEALEAEATLRIRPAERPRRLLAWRDAARCWLNQGETGRATAALQQAEALVQDAPDRLRMLAARCTLHLNTGDSAALAIDGPLLARTLAPQEAALDDDELAHALLGLATGAPYVDDPQDLLNAIEAMASRARGVPRLQARLALCAGIVLNWLGWPARARERLLHADALAVAEGLHSERVNLGNQLARCDEGEGDLDAGIRRCLQTERIARDLGAGPSFEADLANLRGLYEARCGRTDRAREAFDDARRRLGPRGRPSLYMQLREARALLWMDDAEAAGRLAEALRQPASTAVPGPHRAFVGWTLAMLEHAAGQSPVPWLRTAAPVCRGTGTLMALRHHVVCMALGAPQEAASVPSGLPAPTSPGAMADLLQSRALHGLADVLKGASDPAWRDPWIGGAPPGTTTARARSP